MTTQQTSLDAYYGLSRRNIGDRQAQVLSQLRALEEATNTMLSRRTGIPINAVTPRIWELRQMGLVIESRRSICPVTKKKAIFWRCATDND